MSWNDGGATGGNTYLYNRTTQASFVRDTYNYTCTDGGPNDSRHGLWDCSSSQDNFAGLRGLQQIGSQGPSNGSPSFSQEYDQINQNASSYPPYQPPSYYDRGYSSGL